MASSGHEHDIRQIHERIPELEALFVTASGERLPN
jgi:hypothetical protein